MEAAEKQNQLNLLLVEDDIELCGMMKEFFSEAGHRLDCAHNGPNGVASALNGDYDLVILDVMLPVFDGFSVLQQLRRRKDLPVIMFSASADEADIAESMNLGANGYMVKPFTIDAFIGALGNVPQLKYHVVQ